MSDYEYFRPSPAKVAHERCMAYRRAMADASDEADVFLTLVDAAEDPLLSLAAFAQLCVCGRVIFLALRAVHSDQ